MNVNIVSFFKAGPRPRDWTNQELAEFYRVESSLIRAGLKIDTDRGLSDEGDPWFVFCHAESGEIIAHFARFDGQYVIASAALEGSLRGKDFRALIESVIESHPVVLPKQTGGGAKVSIHPAALLVALVMTCFFKLSQTQAFAAEANGDNAHQGSSPPNPDAGKAHAIIIDDRHSTIFLGAIAFAVGWTQSADANTDYAPTNSVALNSPAAEPSHSGGNEKIWADFVTATDPTNAANSHQQETSVAAQSNDDQGGDGNVLFSVIPAALRGEWVDSTGGTGDAKDTSSSAVTVQTTQKELGAANNFGTDQSVLIWHSMPGSSSGTVTASATQLPEAFVETTQLLGSSVLGHQVQDLTQDQPELVLDVVHHVSTNTVASDPSAANTATPVTPVSATISAVTPSPNGGLDNVEAALESFVASTPDYKVITNGSEIVFYDPQINASNANDLVVHEWSFQDGSSVIIIGINPDHGAGT